LILIDGIKFLAELKNISPGSLKELKASVEIINQVDQFNKS
jgi:hypothetical protein